MIHAPLLLALVAAQGWNELDGSASGPGISASPTLSNQATIAMDSVGFPTVLWVERIEPLSILYLKRWNGTSWGTLGPSASGTGLGSGEGIYGRAIAIDAQDRPVIAWSAQSEVGVYRSLYVKRWTGTHWADFGGSGSGTGIDNGNADATNPSLALDAAGRPTVAWLHVDESGIRVALKRWDGAAWTELGGSATAGVTADGGLPASAAPQLALDAEGLPFVAWISRPLYPTNVYMKRWTGEAWEGLGGSATGNGVSQLSSTAASLPALVVDSQGRPVVAWKHPGSPPYTISVYLRRWNGTTWEDLGTSASMNGVSNTPNGIAALSLARDPADRILVAWSEVTDTQDIFVRRWSGSAWEAMGSSMTGGGVSSTGTISSGPSLQVGSTGAVAVAWRELVDATNAEIYVRQWTTIPAAFAGAPAQLRLDGTPMPPGAQLPVQTGFQVRSRASDADGAGFRLQLEVRETGAAFSGEPMATGLVAANGADAWVSIEGLLIGHAYHWHVRTIDDSGTPSPWMEFGSADPDEVDFNIRDNTGPSPSEIAALDAETLAPVSAGSQLAGAGGIRFQARVNDGEQDRTRLEVEIRAEGRPMTGVATDVGAFASSAATASVQAMPLQGRYSFLLRAVDEYGAASPWQSPLGGGAMTFTVPSLGSLGDSKICAAGRTGSVAAWVALLAGLTLAARRI